LQYIILNNICYKAILPEYFTNKTKTTQCKKHSKIILI